MKYLARKTYSQRYNCVLLWRYSRRSQYNDDDEFGEDMMIEQLTKLFMPSNLVGVTRVFVIK